jgi:hypothetical protein
MGLWRSAERLRLMLRLRKWCEVDERVLDVFCRFKGIVEMEKNVEGR